MDADLFAEQVHAVVVQLNKWMKAEHPNPDRLMPALAVVLGRVIGIRAENEDDLNNMVKMAKEAVTAAATEYWHHRTTQRRN